MRTAWRINYWSSNTFIVRKIVYLTNEMFWKIESFDPLFMKKKKKKFHKNTIINEMAKTNIEESERVKQKNLEITFRI